MYPTLLSHPRPFASPPKETLLISRNFPFPPLPSPWQPLILSLSLWIYIFQTFHTNGITQYVTFCVCFLSLSMICSRLIHTVAYTSTVFVSMAEYYSIVCIYHILFSHFSIDGHLNCFHFITIMNDAAMNIHVQLFICTYIFNSLEYIPRSEIAGTYENSV